ncbi:MAG TPA: dNTP triphosphohydrolase [Silvibacterium sp.]|nr:dNTP triphosphohydrolase [Silvibacterium sp.]
MNLLDTHDRFFRGGPRVRRGDDRTPSEKDRDIVLYSSAFKRLLSVTQVASGSSGHVFHTRLTHSLQVAQIGRRLAEKLWKQQKDECSALGGMEPDAVEAACLAHDIGHPPFGHLAEEVLNAESSKFGGFEGNAQSFRIVTQLGIRSPKYSGLNLTRGTLRGILKYPWLHADRPEDLTSPTHRKEKWGAYDCDREVFDWVRELDLQAGRTSRAAEAELMDWSDDVTYSVHDVEDFFRAGLIPLHLLKRTTGQPSNRERDRFFGYVIENDRKDAALHDLSAQEMEGIFDNLLIYTGIQFDQAYEGSRDDHAKLRMFSSRLINRFINALHLNEVSSANARPARREELAEKEVAILKQLTWCYVIDAPSLAIQHRAQRKVIAQLAKTFLNEAVSSKPTGILPIFFREQLRTPGLDESEKKRMAIDLVSNMTEGQAIDLYQRLEGISVAAGFDKIVV